MLRNTTDIRLFGVKWATDQGGPSPDNNMRTELYFMGCRKAMSGDPCDGCYNPDLWETRLDAITRSPQDMAEHIAKFAPNKYITIVGGEPTDQMEGLTELCKLLKAKGFHILVFSWRSLKIGSTGNIHPAWRGLIQNIDILVDGAYKKSERIYNEDFEDGFHNTIGSANQTIWDLKEWNDAGRPGIINGHTAGELVGLYVLPNGDLRYITKDKIEPKQATVIQRGVA